MVGMVPSVFIPFYLSWPPSQTTRGCDPTLESVTKVQTQPRVQGIADHKANPQALGLGHSRVSYVDKQLN